MLDADVTYRLQEARVGHRHPYRPLLPAGGGRALLSLRADRSPERPAGGAPLAAAHRHRDAVDHQRGALRAREIRTPDPPRHLRGAWPVRAAYLLHLALAERGGRPRRAHPRQRGRRPSLAHQLDPHHRRHVPHPAHRLAHSPPAKKPGITFPFLLSTSERSFIFSPPIV